MKKNLLLMITGAVLIVMGGLLIASDKGSCPANNIVPTPTGVSTPIGSCYHYLLGLPMTPTGWVLLFMGIIILIVAFVLSRKRKL